MLIIDQEINLDKAKNTKIIISQEDQGEKIMKMIEEIKDTQGEEETVSVRIAEMIIIENERHTKTKMIITIEDQIHVTTRDIEKDQDKKQINTIPKKMHLNIMINSNYKIYLDKKTELEADTDKDKINIEQINKDLQYEDLLEILLNINRKYIIVEVQDHNQVTIGTMKKNNDITGMSMIKSRKDTTKVHTCKEDNHWTLKEEKDKNMNHTQENLKYRFPTKKMLYIRNKIIKIFKNSLESMQDQKRERKYDD